ncbi:hypothetical protein CBS101457_004098 [Exobasidium rhododendri]|nr:hypothetical protein CBS101457_004098 [Exobasidium rhododendri]
MMELWEKLLVLFVFFTLSSLIWWSFYFHFPDHIRSVAARSTYYIFGTQPNTPKELLSAAAEEALESVRANAANLKAHAEL